MSATPWMPHANSAKLIWLNNFASKLPLYASLFNLTPAEVTQIQNDALDWAKCLNGHQQFVDFLHNYTTWQNHLAHGDKSGAALSAFAAVPAAPVFSSTLLANIFGRAAKTAVIIKKGTKYTPAIGQDLKIIGADPTPTPHTGTSMATDRIAPKPPLKLSHKNGHPKVHYKKNKHQGAKIIVDRGDGKGFILLATVTRANYMDMFALPAKGIAVVWTYRAIYIDKDIEIGDWSDEVQITVTGV